MGPTWVHEELIPNSWWCHPRNHEDVGGRGFHDEICLVKLAPSVFARLLQLLSHPLQNLLAYELHRGPMKGQNRGQTAACGRCIRDKLQELYTPWIFCLDGYVDGI